MLGAGLSCRQIAAVVKQKEATVLARKKFEKDKFDAKQAQRQRMIDRVRPLIRPLCYEESLIMFSAYFMSCNETQSSYGRGVACTETRRCGCGAWCIAGHRGDVEV
jgi:hypothetical protein